MVAGNESWCEDIYTNISCCYVRGYSHMLDYFIEKVEFEKDIEYYFRS